MSSAPAEAWDKGWPPLDRLTVFALLWSAATLFHQAKWDHWASSPPELALSAAAYWILFRPHSLPGLLVLLGIQVWVTIDQSPWVSNHWLLTSFVSLTILIAFARKLLLRSSADRDCIFDSFAPAVRIETLIFYFWTFFHKLNAGWFNPETSCAAEMYANWGGSLLLKPQSACALALSIYAPLLFEGSIPMLLLFPRTRLAGIIAAMGFHFVLGVGYFNFSALMFALLFFFAPSNLTKHIRQFWNESFINKALFGHTSPTRLISKYLIATRVLYVVAILVLLSQAKWTHKPRGFSFVGPLFADRSLISWGFQFLWVLFALTLMAVFVCAVLGSKPEWQSAEGLLKPVPKALVVPVLLVFVNGLCPYVGLKTDTAFAMYSNLRTESGITNHLLVGPELKFADYQEDLVTLVRSSDPELQKLADLGIRLTYFEFRSYLSRKAQSGDTEIALTYVRQGVWRNVLKRENAPELFQPDPILLRKLLYFRPVVPLDQHFCQH